MEFVIVGATGDKGTVEFDTLEMWTMPELPAVVPPVVAKVGDIPAPAAVDGNPETVWTADKATDLTLDLGYLREHIYHIYHMNTVSLEISILTVVVVCSSRGLYVKVIYIHRVVYICTL